MSKTSSRRLPLEGLSFLKGSTTHAGLWLDKLLTSSHREDKEAKRELIDRLTHVKDPPGYREYAKAYFDALSQRPEPVLSADGETRGRMVVGLGANAVLETSITLHRTYGVPYIPGSALKGLASSYAARRLAQVGGARCKEERVQEEDPWCRFFEGGKTFRGDWQRVLFGDTEQSGLIVFFDGLPLPGKWQFEPDVLTVHHPDYYQEGKKPPADWDSPNPVPFLTTTGSFRFAISLQPLPREEIEEGMKWLTLTAHLLKRALEEEGVGAKTSIGYGRFKLEGFAELKPEASEALKEAKEKVGFLRWNNDAGRRLAQIAELWAGLSPAEQKELEDDLLAKKAEVLEHPVLRSERKRHPNLNSLLKKLGARG